MDLSVTDRYPAEQIAALKAKGLWEDTTLFETISAQADAFRRAVQIEHTHGIIRFGLDAAPVRAVFERYPRGNFDRVLLDFTWRTLRREPWTIVNGIFF